MKCALILFFIFALTSCDSHPPMDDASSRSHKSGGFLVGSDEKLPNTIIFSYYIDGYNSAWDARYFTEAVDLIRRLPGLERRRLILISIENITEPAGPGRHHKSHKIGSLVGMQAVLKDSKESVIKSLEAAKVISPFKWDETTEKGGWTIAEPR